MPKSISGEPKRGTFYRGGPHDAIATNYTCTRAGLPKGSTVGACLEASLLRKAADGSEAAMRMVSEWTTKPEVADGDYCEHCGKRPPITFRHVYEQATHKAGNRPEPESAFIEELKHRTPPALADVRAIEQARQKFGAHVTSYFWSGSEGNPDAPPEAVQMSAACLLAWERGKKVYAAFVTMVEEKNPERAAELYDEYLAALREAWAKEKNVQPMESGMESDGDELDGEDSAEGG